MLTIRDDIKRFVASSVICVADPTLKMEESDGSGLDVSETSIASVDSVALVKVVLCNVFASHDEASVLELEESRSELLETSKELESVLVLAVLLPWLN